MLPPSRHHVASSKQPTEKAPTTTIAHTQSASRQPQEFLTPRQFLSRPLWAIGQYVYLAY
jgi:hypothetical protein